MVNKKESTEIKPADNNKLKAGEFINETKEELSKVVWPSRQQLLSESAAVILMVSLVAIVIYLVDNFFSWVANQPFMFGS
ncbi:preprotein translocase subunit SecE [Hydrococcus rivularis NIES-593]|uniref:Protein translocase subunit SecE n=1 Tax=Hydrococcus rivularis NIES-593 TaxID=1921803 RepID=A0A1U7HI64_9CYAN|nr:preprotein translocase subunit SecE [Hydrococcus rivularis]OKH23282.1 preprotein translocase subunit SecE [Hydrococcus rivularis NIES-593]